MLPAVSIIEHW